MVELLIARLNALSKVIAAPETARRISQVAAIAVIADYKTRIFNEGLATNGEPIGEYSTNPFYINPNSQQLLGVSSSGIKPEGKTGQTVFKNGKPHKTKYLTRGYAQLREETGRTSAVVDLNFSGSLFQSIKVTESGTTSLVTYTNAERAEIMLAQEFHFGKDIATVSDDEQKAGQEAAQLELLTILEEIDSMI